MKFIKNKNGVTLIALATTIVVIMILAGVSLSSLTGQDQTLDQAHDVKSAVELKEEKEAIMIAIQETLISSNDGKLAKRNFKKHLEEHIDITFFEYNEGTKEFTIRIASSSRVYVIDEKGNIKKGGAPQ